MAARGKAMTHGLAAKVWLWAGVWAVCGAHSGRPARAADAGAEQPQAKLTVREGTSALLAGADFEFHLDLDAPFAAGTVTWRHSLDDRTLSSGELEIRRGEPATLKLAVPEVKPGVALRTRLDLAVAAKGGGLPDAGATISKTLWVLDPNPFTLRSSWLKSLELSLYDPDGATAKQLETLKIPFWRIGSPGALEKIEGGIVLIGEGIELDKSGSAAEVVFRLAERGVSVVCLAPKSGEMPFPGSKAVSPLAIEFGRDAVVHQLDKRILADAWAAGDPAGTTFLPVAIRGEPRLNVSAEAAGWPWIEADYTKGSALVLCGYPIIGTWDRDATARYLLAAILTRLDEQAQKANEESAVSQETQARAGLTGGVEQSKLQSVQ